MQLRIDQIYTEQSKEYVKTKKDKVKAYKNDKISELNQICDDYTKLGAVEFLDTHLPNYTKSLQAYEEQIRQMTMSG